MAPTAIEYDRPNAAVDVINDAKNLRPDDDAETATLLSRAVPRDRRSRLSNRSLRRWVQGRIRVGLGNMPDQKSVPVPYRADAHGLSRLITVSRNRCSTALTCLCHVVPKLWTWVIRTYPSPGRSSTDHGYSIRSGGHGLHSNHRDHMLAAHSFPLVQADHRYCNHAR